MEENNTDQERNRIFHLPAVHIAKDEKSVIKDSFGKSS